MAGGAGARNMVGSGNPHAAFDAGETFGITVFLDDNLLIRQGSGR